MCILGSLQADVWELNGAQKNLATTVSSQEAENVLITITIIIFYFTLLRSRIATTSIYNSYILPKVSNEHAVVVFHR